MSNIIESSNKALTTNRDTTSLHEYLHANRSTRNISLQILTDLHSNKGIGKLFVKESNDTLYYYPSNKLYYVFSVGGRLISVMAKPTIPMTQSRRRVIRKRFLVVDDKEDEHLIKHFENLIRLSTTRQHTSITRTFAAGIFTVHMRDLATPFIEIGVSGDSPLVIPMQFVMNAAELGMIPITSINYAGQTVVIFANDDYTVRLLYVSHLLTDSLFTGRRDGIL